MMDIRDAPGTIVIQNIDDNNAQSVSLKRLETNQSERQLGIIMPLDGNFVEERIVRWKQSQLLGQKMYRAPLTPYEGVIVYKMYYIPKVGYPLSLTKFTKKECEDIQSQFYQYAPPKMGLNRHTPKALLFGPLQLGGFNLHDIYPDQIIRHVTKISQHIRRNDSVGKAFTSNLRVFEILLGSNKPLMKKNPWNYPYVDRSTTIFYLWKWAKI